MLARQMDQQAKTRLLMPATLVDASEDIMFEKEMPPAATSSPRAPSGLGECGPRLTGPLGRGRNDDPVSEVLGVRRSRRYCLHCNWNAKHPFMRRT